MMFMHSCVDNGGCSSVHACSLCLLQRTHDRPIFFARKFEAIVNQEVISEVEKYISGDDDKCTYIVQCITFTIHLYCVLM